MPQHPPCGNKPSIMHIQDFYLPRYPVWGTRKKELVLFCGPCHTPASNLPEPSSWKLLSNRDFFGTAIALTSSPEFKGHIFPPTPLPSLPALPSLSEMPSLSQRSQAAMRRSLEREVIGCNGLKDSNNCSKGSILSCHLSWKMGQT